MLIDIIAGARPNFIKIAPIISAIEERRAAGGSINYRLVHTGQHYDTSMSDDFFKQLGIPKPHVNFGASTGTQSEQTGKIMIEYERLLSRQRSHLCLVVGDVNSTMACAIVARKGCIPVAHVEAGIRSGDWTMPEEINRILTDSITTYFFTTSEVANVNLQRCGISEDRVFLVGNTMIDSLVNNRCRFVKPKFFDDMRLQNQGYIMLTLHRPANVDVLPLFSEYLSAISKFSRGVPIIFPVHPRTQHTLGKLGEIPPNIHTLPPQPYLEFNFLVQNSKAIITDSGGVSEEATVLGVPCMTLRDSTERPETVTIGTNELLGTNPSALAPALDRLFAGGWKTGAIPPMWDGNTGKRIVREIERQLC
jgi:UDP-N-acetylglucosamine 2-epimerase (non-hydrolysing)